MEIKRKLKHGSFEWNDETKMFKITNGEDSLELGKVYAFAFLRFVFRVAQRNWFRKLEVKPKKNQGKEVICDKNIRDGKLVLTQQEEGMEIEQFILPHCEDFLKEEPKEKEEELLKIN
jgi:hypothetical protein